MSIQRKRWTDEENSIFIEMYNKINDDLQPRTPDEVFEFMATEQPFVGVRTAGGLKRHHAYLIAEAKESSKPKMSSELAVFLSKFNDIKEMYEYVLAENEQLRKRVKELEEVEKDLASLTQIMERARKVAFEVDERPRYKLDGQGNLTRI